MTPKANLTVHFDGISTKSDINATWHHAYECNFNGCTKNGNQNYAQGRWSTWFKGASERPQKLLEIKHENGSKRRNGRAIIIYTLYNLF